MLSLLVYALTTLSFKFSGSHDPHDLFKPVAVTAERAWNLWGWIWVPDNVVTVMDQHNPVEFASRPALFGEELKQPTLGYVIPLSAFTTPCTNTSLARVGVQSHNLGCPDLCMSEPDNSGPVEPWIALVQRGSCPFAAKAREAERLGAKAIVIGGEDPTWNGNPDTLISMMGPGEDINITATYIKFSDYEQLNSLIEHSSTVHSGLRTVSLVISPDTPSGGWVSPALTFVAILLLPSFLTFLTLLVHRFRMVRAARRERAPEDIVRNLPWRVWTGRGWEKHEGMVPGREHPVTTPEPAAVAPMDVEQGILVHASTSTANAGEDVDMDADVDADDGEPAWAKTQYECAICLSEFAVGDRVRVLPCAHIFHMDEVDGWLINNRKLCPVCKADVTQPAGSAAEQVPEPAPSSPATERTPLLSHSTSTDSSTPSS